MGKSIIIVGGGAAGLAAAVDLSAAGWRVTILEARARLGGRLHSFLTPAGVPVDYGPEFVHGAAPEIKELAGAEIASPATTRERLLWRDRRESAEAPLSRAEKILDLARETRPDRSLAELMRHADDPLTEAVLRSYLEGLNALDVNLASQSSFAQERRVAGDEETVGRLPRGYAPVLEAMRTALGKTVSVRLETRAEEVLWRKGHVEVAAKEPGERTSLFTADALLLTLPPSLLAESSFLKFSPEIPRVREAARALPMGTVHKVQFVLSEPLLDSDVDIAFLHSPELLFGARWQWNFPPAPILSVWSGGARAAQLDAMTTEDLIAFAKEETARALGRTRAEVEARIAAAYAHDWGRDPYSRGAYSYVRTGSPGAREALARAEQGTLFFAGEATQADGSTGTVHGAIRSGRRAAKEIVRAS